MKSLAILMKDNYKYQQIVKRYKYNRRKKLLNKIYFFFFFFSFLALIIFYTFYIFSIPVSASINVQNLPFTNKGYRTIIIPSYSDDVLMVCSPMGDSGIRYSLNNLYFNGDAFTKIPNLEYGAYSRIFYLKNPDIGAYNLTTDNSGHLYWMTGWPWPDIACFLLSGVDTENPIASTSIGSTSNGITYYNNGENGNLLFAFGENWSNWSGSYSGVMPTPVQSSNSTILGNYGFVGNNTHQGVVSYTYINNINQQITYINQLSDFSMAFVEFNEIPPELPINDELLPDDYIFSYDVIKNTSTIATNQTYLRFYLKDFDFNSDDLTINFNLPNNLISDFENGYLNVPLYDNDNNFKYLLNTSTILINSTNFPTNDISLTLSSSTFADLNATSSACFYLKVLGQANLNVFLSKTLGVCLYSADFPFGVSNDVYTDTELFAKTKSVWRRKLIFSTFMTIYDGFNQYYLDVQNSIPNDPSTNIDMSIDVLGTDTDLLDFPDDEGQSLHGLIYDLSTYSIILLFCIYIVWRVRNSFGSHDI